MNEVRFSADDSRLTAYALGELAPDEVPALEAALRDSPELRAAVEDIRACAVALETALAEEIEPAVAAGVSVPAEAATRGAISPPEAASEESVALPAGAEESQRRQPERPRRRWIVFPQFYFVGGGLAVAAFAVMVALHRDAFDAKEQRRVEGLRAVLQRPGQQGQNSGSSTIIAINLPPGESSSRSEEAGAIATRAGAGTRLTPRNDPAAVVSLDLGRASYDHVRRLIEVRQLPSADQVSPGALINAFKPRLPAPPTSTAPVAVALEVTGAPWAPDRRLVRIGLRARELLPAQRPAANLVFLIGGDDTAGRSERLDLIKVSLRHLLGLLRDDDHVALLRPAKNAGLVLPPTPVARSQDILAAIGRLEPGDARPEVADFSRALALAQANRVQGGRNLVILCHDGALNVAADGGPGVRQLVVQQAAAGLGFSTIGFGLAGRWDEIGEDLAEAGGGRHAYIDSPRQAQQVFADGLARSLAAVARGVRVEVEFNPATVASYRLLGRERDVAARVRPADDLAAADELIAGQTITALYEVVPTAPVALRAAASTETPAGLLTVRMRYSDPQDNESRVLEFPLADHGEDWEAASADFRLSAAVAKFALTLRQAPRAGAASLRDVLDWANDDPVVLADDPDGQRTDFVDLVRRAQQLME